jgi:hypothetical protein
MTIFAVFTTTTKNKKKLNNIFFCIHVAILERNKTFFISYYFCFVLCVVVAFFLLIRILALSFVWQIGISKMWKVLHWAASCLKLLCWVSAFLPPTYYTTQHNIKYSETLRCFRSHIFVLFLYTLLVSFFFIRSILFHSFSFVSFVSFFFIRCHVFILLHVYILFHCAIKNCEELKKASVVDLKSGRFWSHSSRQQSCHFFIYFLAMSYSNMSKRLEWSIRKIMLLSFQIMIMYWKRNFY